MISTQIFLSGASGYCSINLYKDENIDIVASVADVRNISNRNSTFTKQITFPATAFNNDFFNHIFEISSDSTFNPNRKTACYIAVESVPVIDHSYFQLTDIVIDYSNNIAEYKGVIYANNFDFFKLMGNKTIDELNWSGVSFSVSQSKIENSWITDYTNGVVFPLIDRGYGWSYPSISPGIGSPIKVEQFKPCVYEKYLLDLIFAEAGFTYQSDFLNGAYFKQFIIEGITETTKKVDYNVHLDYGLVYLSVTDSYCTYEAQLVRERPSGAIEVLATFTEDWDAAMGSYRVTDFSGTASVQTGDKIYVRFIFFDFHKMAYFEPQYGAPCTFTLDYQNTPIGDMSVATNTNTHYNFTTPVQTVIVDFQNTISDPNSTWNGNVHTVPSFTDGRNIKTNIKQSDYFSWLINRFNLYIDTDHNQQNKLIIEPRASYYTSNTGTTKDWTSKLDVSKPLEVKLLSELQDKQIILTYKEDQDKLNSEYKNIEKRIYGDRIVNFDNDFLTSEKKIEIGFSPTPLQNIPGSSEIIIPTIYPVDNSNSDFSYNIRSLYWGGLLSLANESFRIQYGTATTADYTSYPYAGELDNPIYPTFSIMFGTPLTQYFNNNNPTGLYPATDLYTTYWRDWIETISDKNSKLITAYFNVTPTDIQEFKFSDKIFLINQNYIVNKFFYNALGKTTAKFELLKIEPIPPLAETDKKLGARMGRGVNGISVGYDNTIYNRTLSVGDGNRVSPSAIDILINGDQNLISKSASAINLFGDNNLIVNSASTVSVFGNYNTGKTLISNVFVLGSGNTVDRGVRNLTLLGVNNFSATTAHTNTVITSRLLVQSGLTANTLTVNSINGTPFSGLTNSYLPISGGTVTGTTTFNSGVTFNSGIRVNSNLAKLVPYTATTSDYLISVDTSIGMTVYLPQSPATGTYLIISDYYGAATVNPFTVRPLQTGNTIQNATGLTISTNYMSVHIIYISSLSDWQIVSYI